MKKQSLSEIIVVATLIAAAVAYRIATGEMQNVNGEQPHLDELTMRSA